MCYCFPNDFAFPCCQSRYGSDALVARAIMHEITSHSRQRGSEDIKWCSKRHRASPDYGEGGHGNPRRSRDTPHHSAQLRSSAEGDIEYISEFVASRHSASEDEDDDGGRPTASAAAGEAHLEATPWGIDPAAAGGPVALPAAGSIMRGRTRYSEAEQFEERAREAVARQRITMNRAGRGGGGGGGGVVAESRQERLRRLTAAQFNSSVARDTKRVLDKRAREAEDERARQAIERSARALPPAPPDPKNRGADRRECVPSSLLHTNEHP
jgi:hypothetical protein